MVYNLLPLPHKKDSAPLLKVSLKQGSGGAAGRAVLSTAGQAEWPLTCEERGQAGQGAGEP